MTLDGRIARARWYLAAIESRSSAQDPGALEVALGDADALARDVFAIGGELARRHALVGGAS